MLCMIAVADAVAVAATLACESAGRGHGCSPHRSPLVRPSTATCRYRCSCAIPPWPAAHPRLPSLRPFQQARSCTKMDGAKTSAARQTSRYVRTADRAAIAVAVAAVVTVAAAVAMTATVAGGHCTPPCACSRVRSCSRSCPLLRLPREPRGPRAQISAELRTPRQARPRTVMDGRVPLLPTSRVRVPSVERTR